MVEYGTYALLPEKVRYQGPETVQRLKDEMPV
jgi:hypothetical protein